MAYIKRQQHRSNFFHAFSLFWELEIPHSKQVTIIRNFDEERQNGHLRFWVEFHDTPFSSSFSFIYGGEEINAKKKTYVRSDPNTILLKIESILPHLLTTTTPE